MSDIDNQKKKSTVETPKTNTRSPEHPARDQAIEASMWKGADIARREFLERTARQEAERRVIADKANGTKIAALNQQLGIKDQNQLREQTIERALASGGARIYTSVYKNLSQLGRAGYQSVEDQKINDGRAQAGIGKIIGDVASQLEGGGQSGIDGSLKKRGLHELIDVRMDKKSVYQRVLVPGRKGVLGIGGTPDTWE